MKILALAFEAILLYCALFDLFSQKLSRALGFAIFALCFAFFAFLLWK